MEFAGSPFEVKELTASGAIEGLLAGFGDVDNGGDKLLAGCFTKSLASRAQPLPMLLCHDQRRPIGAWHEWQERDDGLHVKGAIALETRDGQEAHALVKTGALTGLSIGWKAKEGVVDRKAMVRTISAADIHEGSLVPCPMHSRTRITSVKSIRDLEDVLREGGFSGRQAKHAAGLAWRVREETPDNEAELAELAAMIGASTARLNAIGRH